MPVKTVKHLMLPLLLLLGIPGSIAPGRTPALPIVNRVDVECRQGAVYQQRHYSSDEKISWVLNYLRMQKNLGKPEEDPERAAGDMYTVFVSMADGQKLVCRQRADRYFCRSDQIWQKIDPDWGSSFYYLLQTLPSDPEP